MTDNYEDKYDISNRLIKEHGPLSKATRQLDYALDLLELAQEAFLSFAQRERLSKRGVANLSHHRSGDHKQYGEQGPAHIGGRHRFVG